MAGRIKGITIEIGGSTKALSTAMKDIDSQSKKLASELRDVEKLLKLDPTNTELVAQKQKLLAEQIKVTETRLTALKEAQANISPEDVGEEKYRALEREIAATETSLKGYKSALSNVKPEQEALNTNQQRLSTLLAATKSDLSDYTSVLGTRLVNAIKDGTASSDQLEVAIDKIGKQALGSETDLNQMKQALDKVDDGNGLDGVKNDLQDIAQEAGNAGDQLETMSGKLDVNNLQNASGELQNAAQNVLQFGQNAYDAFTDYDSGCDIIIKKTGATGDSVQQFSDIYDYLVNNIAVTDPYEKAGSAVGELNTQFGLTGDALQSASTSVMEFAEINDSDVTSSVQNAEQAMASFNMTSDQLPGVLDAVTYAAQTTGASADTIFQSCISGSETLQSLGLSFSESAILMGQFSQAGIDSSTAVSVLGKAQVKFAGEGKTMQQGLSDLQSVINSNASEEDKLAAVTDVLGSKGALNFLKLAESGKLNFADLASSADASVGSVSSTFDSVTGSDEQLELALQNLQSAFATLGGAIAEALLPIIQTLAPLIKNLADWFTSLPDGVQQAIVIFTALMTVFGLLLPVILAIVVGFGSFGAILLPIIGIAAGIAAAITAVILIIQNWGSICEWFGNLWNAIWSGVTSFFGGVGQSIQDTWNGAMDWIKQKADDAKSGILSTFQGIEDGCINAFNSVKDGITNAISTAYNNVKYWFQKIEDTLSGTLSFPNIKMPHFSITGSFNLNPPKVPTFGVQWYAKGGVLTKPTLFGMNGDQAMGGGDAGPEAVAPISVLQQYVSQAVEGSNAQIAALLSSIFDYMQSGQMIPVTELDGEVITKVVESNISDKQTSARRAKGY